jgi:hypothetical protein
LSDLPRLALSGPDVAEILRASGKVAVLVGGQALAVWAQFYQLALPSLLTANVTRDADFIGSADTALLIKGRLSNPDWKFYQVKPGAPSPVTAQLILQTGEGIKEIDFLGSIIGIPTDDLRGRVVTLKLPDDLEVMVLHPLDVLASRLHNLAELAEKRNDKGLAHARLAIDVAGALLRDTLAHRTERGLFNQIERIRIILTDPKIAAVCRQFALDVLACVPLERITNEAFRSRRWPQIQRDVHLALNAKGA